MTPAEFDRLLLLCRLLAPYTGEFPTSRRFTEADLMVGVIR